MVSKPNVDCTTMDLLCLTHQLHRLTDEIAISFTFCSGLLMLSVGREIDLKIFCLVRILKHIGDNICRILRYNTVCWWGYNAIS